MTVAFFASTLRNSSRNFCAWAHSGFACAFVSGFALRAEARVFGHRSLPVPHALLQQIPPLPAALERVEVAAGLVVEQIGLGHVPFTQGEVAEDDVGLGVVFRRQHRTLQCIAHTARNVRAGEELRHDEFLGGRQIGVLLDGFFELLQRC